MQSQHQDRLQRAASAVPSAPELTVQFVERYNSHTTRLNQLLVTCNESKARHSNLDSEAHSLQEEVRGLTEEVDAARERSHSAVVESNALRAALGKFKGKELSESAVVARVLAVEKEKERVGASTEEDSIPWCHVCRKSTESYLMVLCDTCKRMCHLECHDPPLDKMPTKSRYK